MEAETALRIGQGAALPDLSGLDYLCGTVMPPMPPMPPICRGRVPAELATITAKVLEKFPAVMAMSEQERQTLILVWLQGRDTRRAEW